MNKKIINKIICLIISVLLVVSMCGCGQNEKAVVMDTSPLTMYIGLGNTNSSYYSSIHEGILKSTGIDVQFVYSNTLDTTNAIADRTRHYDLPADIVITASMETAEEQKNSFLDLAAYTNIPDLFTISKLKDVLVDSSIYQLPFTTRLVGIEYNKTLLDEMGWELPQNFEEMVSLKEKVEAAGYTFAVSGGVATGHGFNYLMYIMGVEYLAFPDGTEWLNDFLEGNTDITGFNNETGYFEKYVKAGLFGSVHYQDWSASAQFKKERALFYYNILNDAYSYDGFRYNPDGTLYGAEYLEDGEPFAVKDSKGNAVYVDGGFAYYEESNPKHQNIQRYVIPGTVELHDVYASMPWISENGSSNCYVCYNSMYLALDKKLGNKEQAEKLDKAMKVMTYLASNDAAKIFSDMFNDGFVATTEFTIDESRLYYDNREYIEKGYLMPWYYNKFDSNSIVNVGEQVNNYLRNIEGSSISKISDTLAAANKALLSPDESSYYSIADDYSYEETARLEAIANAMSLQEKLYAFGIDKQLEITLMPYTNDIKDLPSNQRIGVIQEKLRSGRFLRAEFKKIISSYTSVPVAAYMTGEEISKLLSSGYNIKEDYGIDQSFPYTIVKKDASEIDSSKTYLICIPKDAINKSLYRQLQSENRILADSGKEISGSTEEGLEIYLANSLNYTKEELLTW